MKTSKIQHDKKVQHYEHCSLWFTVNKHVICRLRPIPLWLIQVNNKRPQSDCSDIHDAF